VKEKRLEDYKDRFAARDAWSLSDLAEVFGRSESRVRSLLEEEGIPFEASEQEEDRVEINGKALAVGLMSSSPLQAALEAARANSEPTPGTAEAATAEAAAGPAETPGEGANPPRERVEKLEREIERLEEENQRLQEQLERPGDASADSLSPEEIERIREEGRQEVLAKINTFSNLLAGRIEAWMDDSGESEAGLETLIDLMKPSDS